ncbi:MAG: tryptophan-rich sensory protein [Armatimonadetes bacterium]|nr:tryptophan-rich sensory protein [Armatimonadota bacterium]
MEAQPPSRDEASSGARLAALVIALAVCFGAAALGGIATASSVGTWYPELRKPPFTPPSWVFGPVWTVLYGLMGVAAWLVWRSGKPGVARRALWLFVAQLGLNVAWSWLFFGLRQPGWAFLEICLLWLAIGATMVAFWGVSRRAGWLLAPYLLWVTFAAALNLGIWLLNR